MTTNGTNGTGNPAGQRRRRTRAGVGDESALGGVQRNYTAADVLKLRPSLLPESTIANYGAERLWNAMQDTDFVRTFGAVTGAQAVQMAKAGLQSIYVSGWQVAADANTAAHTYPDQSLYPVNSVPSLVKRLNNALMRADRSTAWRTAPASITTCRSGRRRGRLRGPIHAFELMRNMIESGAAGVHYEDQLAAEKKCGHMGGKVLVPTAQHVRTLQAARPRRRRDERPDRADGPHRCALGDADDHRHRRA